MVTTLLFIAAILWVPVILFLLHRRALAALLIWLVIGPVVSNMIKWPGANPFFWMPSTEKRIFANNYLTMPTAVSLSEALEPTRLLVMTLLALIVGERIVRRKKTLPFDRTEKFMAFFTALLVLSSVLFSNKSLYSLRTTADVYLVPFLCYYLTRRLIRGEAEFRKLTRAIAWLGLYVSAACLAERIVNPYLTYRLKGPYVQGALRGSSILHMAIIVIFFAILLDALTARRNEDQVGAVKRELRWILILASPLIILFTWTRGNWIGFLLGVWVFLLLGRNLLSPSKRFAVTGLAFVVLPLAAVGVLALKSTAVMDERIGNTYNVLGRFATWKVVAKQGLQHPILGLGLNNTRDILAESSDEVEGAGSYSTVHNSYLTFFAELGAVGFVAYVLIVYSLFRTGYLLYRRGIGPRERWRGAAMIALLLAYLTPGLFASTIQMLGLGHMLVFSFLGGVVGATWKPENLLERAKPREGSVNYQVDRRPVSVGALKTSRW